MYRVGLLVSKFGGFLKKSFKKGNKKKEIFCLYFSNSIQKKLS
jgi:hypothetical protein